MANLSRSLVIFLKYVDYNLTDFDRNLIFFFNWSNRAGCQNIQTFDKIFENLVQNFEHFVQNISNFGRQVENLG